MGTCIYNTCTYLPTYLPTYLLTYYVSIPMSSSTTFGTTSFTSIYLVVDEELRRHHHEPEHVHEPHERVQHPAVPPPVLLVQQGVGRIPHHEGCHEVQQVRRRGIVELLRLTLEALFGMHMGEGGGKSQ